MAKTSRNAEKKTANKGQPWKGMSAESYLRQHGCDTIETALGPIKDYFNAIESRKPFDLAPLDTSTDLEELKEIVSKLTGRTITKVVPISISCPIPKPDWMNWQEFETNYDFSRERLYNLPTGMTPKEFGKSKDRRICLANRKKYFASIDTALEKSDPITNTLSGSLDFSLTEKNGEKYYNLKGGEWFSLLGSFEKRIMGDDPFDKLTLMGGRIMEMTGDNMSTILCKYLEACALKDAEHIESFRKLLVFSSKFLLYGFKKDEPKTLLFFCR